ncbi:hypothetical protein Xekk_03294 [Xenorhabdus sp. KK7.4]|nr:hypothetical protein Xekk_03294 [Xenorhabdus sp. KK7.4]
MFYLVKEVRFSRQGSPPYGKFGGHDAWRPVGQPCKILTVF